MANICEKAISILAGNLNSGRSYLITAVTNFYFDFRFRPREKAERICAPL